MTTLRVAAIALLALLLVKCSFQAFSQPSGGPYGPLAQTYALPSVKGSIFYVAPDGKSGASGRTLGAPTTIEEAFKHVRHGDAIVMRGGTYRTGDLVLNQGITIQPYGDEHPVMKGTLVAANWKDCGNGLWKTSWSKFFPSKADTWWNRDKYVKETPLFRFNNDMVFVDGKFLQAVGREGDVDEHSYYIDYENGAVYIGTDPTHRLVEITAFDGAIKRVTGECNGVASDRTGPVLRGIMLTQYAYCAFEVEGKEPEGVSPESEHGKDVVGTTLEDCTITFCGRVAAYLRGDHLTVRRCKVSDTSTEGLYIIGSSDVLMEKNIFSRNNIEQITGYYPAAVKIFNQSYRVTCRDNLVTDLPYSNGIWYDVGNVDGVFVNNWVQDVGSISRPFDKTRPWPSANGFFFEISKGVICAGNVFVNCDHGMMILNSSNARIYQNTFVNSVACIARNGRSPANDGTFGWHSGTGPVVAEREKHVFVNNLLAGGEDFTRPLLWVWQPDSMYAQLQNPMVSEIGTNVFVRQSAADGVPLAWWSPSKDQGIQIGVASIGELERMFPKVFAHNREYHGAAISPFTNPLLSNFNLVKGFPAGFTAQPMPLAIGTVLGVKKSEPYVGAYPMVQ